MMGEELLRRLEYIDDDLILESKPIEMENKSGVKRKIYTFILIAALFVTLVMTASAASKGDWDVAIANFMGISNADTEQLRDGTVQINSSSVCSNGDESIKITAAYSVGDSSSACIRFDTNYTVPSDFDTEKEYYCTGDFDIDICKRKNGTSLDYSAVLSSETEDGKLYFLLMTSDVDNLNKDYIDITFTDLYRYNRETEENEKIFEGTWSFSWKYSYRSQTVKKNIGKIINLNGTKCLITSVKISPLEVKVYGIAFGKGCEMSIERINFNDGHSISPESNSGSGTRNSFWIESYCDSTELGEVIDPNNVYSITVDAEELIL